MADEMRGGMLLTRKRISLFDNTLKVSWIGGFRALSKAIAAGASSNKATLLGSFADLWEVVSDAPDHRAWLLIRRAMGRALCELIHSLDAEVGPIDETALREAETELELDALVTEIDVSFLTSPWRLDLLRDLHVPLSQWLRANGMAADKAQALANRLRAHFVCALHDEWADKPRFYEPLHEALTTPFTDLMQQERAWWQYFKGLREEVNKPMMVERFGLQTVYMPLRAWWQQGEHGRRVVVELSTALDAWLGEGDKRDMLRVLSGGPGSGKSSFTRMYAAEVAERGEWRVLRIALHELDYQKDLRRELWPCVKRLLPFNPLDPDGNATPEPLLLILDGLDELAMHGQVATEAACKFVGHVQRVLLEENKGPPWLRILLSGREMVIEASESELRDEKQILHLLPYDIRGQRTDMMRGSWHDPEGLLAEDQRVAFWERYIEALQRAQAPLPQTFRQGELDEVTRQPLLMYLVAFSYLQGKLDPGSADLNSVYAGLITAVWERSYDDSPPLPNIKPLKRDPFERLLQAIAIATWHGNGRSATVEQIKTCVPANLQQRLREFAVDAQSGVADLLTAFYFRHSGDDGDRHTFEFTHKSFSEYLVARRLLAELRTIHKELATDDEDGDARGRTPAECLKWWLELCGPAPLTVYTLRFLRREIQLCKDEAPAWQQCLARLISHAVAVGAPVESLSPRPAFRNELRLTRNAEEALLVIAALCSDVSGQTTAVTWRSPHAASAWLRRLHSQSTDDDAEYWGSGARHAGGLWAGEGTSFGQRNQLERVLFCAVSRVQPGNVGR